MNTEYSDKLDELYRLGGTSGGARPKIMTTIEGEEWIIKFPAHVDGRNAGKMEYDYSCCARQCGIAMSKARLFPSDKCEGYFGTKRFDRMMDNGSQKRIHMLTAAALLELDFEQPSLDYHSLMKLTKILTRDHPEDVNNMFRRMCFNVFAHNRDDHSKNFTYLYHDAEDCWRLSLHTISLTAIPITENIQPQWMEMGAIQEKRRFWQLELPLGWRERNAGEL